MQSDIFLLLPVETVFAGYDLNSMANIRPDLGEIPNQAGRQSIFWPGQPRSGKQQKLLDVSQRKVTKF